MLSFTPSYLGPALAHEEKLSWPKSVIVELAKSFDDERGSIQPLVDMKMKSSVLITSNEGAVRANHYHKTDWHYCYVISGSIKYYYRPTGSDADPKCVITKAGEMVFTPPMVDHGMVFPEDTVFETTFTDGLRSSPAK